MRNKVDTVQSICMCKCDDCRQWMSNPPVLIATHRFCYLWEFFLHWEDILLFLSFVLQSVSDGFCFYRSISNTFDNDRFRYPCLVEHFVHARGISFITLSLLRYEVLHIFVVRKKIYLACSSFERNICWISFSLNKLFNWFYVSVVFLLMIEQVLNSAYGYISDTYVTINYEVLCWFARGDQHIIYNFLL